MEKTRQYFCKPCNKEFTVDAPWHPECLLCSGSETYEVIICDVCQNTFYFGDPQNGGIIANPDYVGGNHHEVLLENTLYLIELAQWHTCFNCCHALLLQDKGKLVPPKKCIKCSDICQDMHGWDGSEVIADLSCDGGYGSTQFDMERHQFNLVPGWHCYKCLDTEVKKGRTKKLSAHRRNLI